MNLDYSLVQIIEQQVRERYKEQFEKMEAGLLEDYRDIGKKIGLKKQIKQVKLTANVAIVLEDK